MIKENILKIKENIASSCAKINCPPDKITIVAVTKGRTTAEIKQAIESSIADIGENKVQEAITKYNELQALGSRQEITWHMVGHLQTNKVKDALNFFDLIHSVDSLKLAQEIDKQASNLHKIQDVLIEVNTSFEETKFGIRPNQLIDLISQAIALKNIKIKGLMTMAPLVDNAETARQYFRKLRLSLDEINKIIAKTNYGNLNILSMGMSQDYQVAIEEGANMLRIGRAIFEDTDEIR